MIRKGDLVRIKTHDAPWKYLNGKTGIFVVSEISGSRIKYKVLPIKCGIHVFLTEDEFELIDGLNMYDLVESWERTIE